MSDILRQMLESLDGPRYATHTIVEFTNAAVEITIESHSWSLKMKASSAPPKTIDEYISCFPREIQEILQKIRSIIQKAAPDAEEAIKYQIPTFVLNGNLVHFAAFQNHIGFYPTPSAIEGFKDQLSAYQSAKGSVQFPVNKPIPFALIGKIVRLRVKEAQAKAEANVKKSVKRQVKRKP